jgi:hypothetical protein
MAAGAGKVITLNKREFKDKIFDYSFSREWKYKGEMPAVIDFYADFFPFIHCFSLLRNLYLEPALSET